MSVKIHLPTALRPYASNQDCVEADGASVAAALESLAGKHAELKKHLFDEAGKLRSFVNVYLNDTDIRSLKGAETQLKKGDELMIVPSIAGGSSLSAEESQRYSRHLSLPEVGTEGQKKLKASKVLCVGAGGLGSPSTMYLAAAGVGTIGLVDSDLVEASNLHRQILYSSDMVGKPKLAAAKMRLSGLNPNVRIVLHETKLTSANALEILKDYDVVIDGTDNFPTRYLVNDACVLLKKPNVYASIFRFEGQLSVFDARQGPCYRCLYAEPPPPGLVPSCAEGGVLGVLPGVMGTLQAVETIKLLLGAGEPAVGRLILFDALKMTFKTLKLKKDAACPICSKKPTIKALIDYEQFCGVKPPAAAAKAVPDEITVEELKGRLDRKETFVLLDVREPFEYDIAKIPGSTLIPLGQLQDRVGELDKSADMVVHCKMGGRSARAVQFLRSQGFKNAVNLAGGIDAWAQRIDKKVPRY